MFLNEYSGYQQYDGSCNQPQLRLQVVLLVLVMMLVMMFSMLMMMLMPTTVTMMMCHIFAFC